MNIRGKFHEYEYYSESKKSTNTNTNITIRENFHEYIRIVEYSLRSGSNLSIMEKMPVVKIVTKILMIWSFAF